MFKGLIGALRVDLGMNSAEFTKGADQAISSVQRIQKRMGAIASRMSIVGAKLSVGATLPLVAFAKKSMNAAEVQESAVAAMETALFSMGNVAGYTSERLQAMASELQNESLYGDEEILQKVTANLLTFGNVTGEVFARAQQSALDLSARLGQDLQSSTVMLGKALNDPVKGITALTRVGVSFTEQQKNQIKAMAEAGDVAGAQSLILDELNKQYAGQAEALRNLPAGQIQAASMAIGDAMEKVGSIILPVVAEVATYVEDLAVRFQNLSPETQRLIVLGGSLAAALGPVAVAFGATVAAVGALISPVGAAVAGVAALAAGAAYLVANWDTLTARWPVLQGIFDALKYSVWLPVTLMVTLGKKVAEVIQKLGGFGDTMVFLSDLSAEVWGRIAMLAGGFGSRFEAIVGKIKAVWAAGVSYLADKWAGFVGTIAPTFNAIAEKAGSALRLDAMATATWASGLENAAQNAKTLAANADLAADAMIAAAKAPLVTLDRLNAKVTEVAEDAEDEAGGAADVVSGAVEDVEDALDNAGDAGATAGGKIAKGLEKALPVAETLAETLAKIAETTFDNIAEGLANSLAKGDLVGGIKGVFSDYMSGATTSFSKILKDAFTGGGFASIGASLSTAWSGFTGALGDISWGSIGSVFSGIGAAASKIMPVVGLVSAVVGIIKGFSSKKLTASGFDFAFEGGELVGGTYETWKKSSFWGLKKSTSTKHKAFDEETSAIFNEQIEAVQDAVAATYKAAGEAIEDGFIEGFDYDFGKINTKGMSEDEVSEALSKAFAAYGDAISEAIGGVGLELAATFAQVKNILEPSGQSFLGTFAEMAKAAANVADLVGGTSALASGVSSFVATYFSEAERFQMVSDRVAGVFDDLGFAIPDTLKGFRDLILSQDLMTESGREAYAALLGVADAFAAVNAGLDESFDLSGGWYANEYEARLAQVAAARGYSTVTEVAQTSGTTQYGRTSLGGDEGAAVQLLQTMLGIFKNWDEEGYPQERSF
ncbi:phage tail length tape measure family protein [Celeribacter ethanolicus]|uniref:phage tail length tape measure family protein n=1 Tax=Celeribacter ethanolicus TaxID=1758178 RepID=UPI000829F150|nr:phage tail length tape measure family protein [Celeribacter ethanolicus]TNE64436.1 MAG: hypothetical protein EP336_15210 [Paracoccaceae bacterium]